MTKNAPISIAWIISERLLIFEFFLQYWDAAIIIYDEEAAYYKRQEIFNNLDYIWKKNSWNIDEVVKVCSKIDIGLEELSPNLFFGKELGYVDHIKSWFLVEFCPS